MRPKNDIGSDTANKDEIEFDMMYLNIILISLIWVFILDISGFWNEASAILMGWITRGKIKKSFQFKPFSCSLCMTFWTSLIYVICINGFSMISLAFICLMAYLTGAEGQLLMTIEALIMKIIELIQNIIK